MFPNIHAPASCIKHRRLTDWRRNQRLSSSYPFAHFDIVQCVHQHSILISQNDEVRRRPVIYSHMESRNSYLLKRERLRSVLRNNGLFSETSGSVCFGPVAHRNTCSNALFCFLLLAFFCSLISRGEISPFFLLFFGVVEGQVKMMALPCPALLCPFAFGIGGAGEEGE